MKNSLSMLLPQATIEHIGSTAVEGLPAKDVVDIAIGVDEVNGVEARLVDAGFILEGNREGHAWLCSPSKDAREYVIHIFVNGSQQWQDRIDFRDGLRRYIDLRDKYLAVKREAAQQHQDWTSYTAAKAEAVARILSDIRERD